MGLFWGGYPKTPKTGPATSGTLSVKKELAGVQSNLNEVEKLTGMKTSAEKAQLCWNRRLSTNLTNNLFELYDFLDPAVRQTEVFTTEKLEKMQEKTLNFAEKYFERRGQDFSKAEFAKEVGRFILRPTVDKDTNFIDWWSMKAVSFHRVALFAITIGECNHSEAAVERAFRAQSFIFDELRSCGG